MHLRKKLPSRAANNRWAITNKMFLSLLLTGAVVEFSNVGAGFIDGLVISRYLGEDAMAASGIAHPIFSIIGIVSGLLAIGMQVRCSQAIGRGNREEYCRFVSATIYVGLVTSLVFSGFLCIFSVPAARLLGASGNAADLIEPTSRYLLGVVIGAPAMVMTSVLSPALQLDTGRKTIQTVASPPCRLSRSKAIFPALPELSEPASHLRFRCCPVCISAR